MKLQKVVMLLLVIILLLVACNQEDEQEDAMDENASQTKRQSLYESRANEEVINIAEEFVAQLSEGHYEEATEKFDETMAEQLGPEALQELWKSLNSQLGELNEYEYRRTESVDGYEVVLINGVFNHADATFQVTVDHNQQIAGFYIQ